MPVQAWVCEGIRRQLVAEKILDNVFRVGDRVQHSRHRKLSLSRLSIYGVTEQVGGYRVSKQINRNTGGIRTRRCTRIRRWQVWRARPRDARILPMTPRQIDPIAKDRTGTKGGGNRLGLFCAVIVPEVRSPPDGSFRATSNLRRYSAPGSCPSRFLAVPQRRLGLGQQFEFQGPCLSLAARIPSCRVV